MTNRILLTIFVFQLTCLSAAAQPALAKMTYEDAEKAYHTGEYSKTLYLLNQVESMINGTSPKTMYLRILTLDKQGFSDFSMLTALRRLCSEFIIKYRSIGEVEDLYREVYALLNRLDSYPRTLEDFMLLNKMEAKTVRVKELEKMMTDVQHCPLKIGMKRSEIAASIFYSLRSQSACCGAKTRYTGVSEKNWEEPIGIRTLDFDENDILIRYEYNVALERDYASVLTRYNMLKDKLMNLFSAKVDKITVYDSMSGWHKDEIYISESAVDPHTRKNVNAFLSLELSRVQTVVAIGKGKVYYRLTEYRSK